MAKTAIQMVMEASARIGHVTPAEARAEIDAGSATVLDIRSPPSGRTTSPAPSRCREGCSRRRPIRPARDTCPRSTRPVA